MRKGEMPRAEGGMPRSDGREAHGGSDERQCEQRET